MGGRGLELSVSRSTEQNAIGMVAKMLIKSEDDEYGSVFGGYNQGAPTARYVPQITRNTGEAPSFGFVSIPLKDFGDEQAYKVALKKDGPLRDLLLRTRTSLGFLENGKFLPVLNGYISNIRHDFNTDSAILEVPDDKWVLSKYTVVGRYTFDPRGSDSSTGGKAYLDTGAPCVFNDNGPDCLDGPSGPMFAPSPFFGWRSTDDTEPAPGLARTRARSWRVADALKYFASGKFASNNNGYGLRSLPRHVRFPRSAQIALGADALRYLKNYSAENKSLLQVLSELGRKAGPYELEIKPLGDWDSEIGFVDMNPRVEKGIKAFLPDHDSATLAGAMNGELIAQAGYISESIVNYFDGVTIIGDPPAVERMFSQTDLPDPPGLIMLEAAWDELEFTAFKELVDDPSSKGLTSASPDTPGAFELALEKYPKVLRNYRVKAGVDIFKGTKWAGRSIGGVYPRILPKLLSGTILADIEKAGEPQLAPFALEVETSEDNWTKVENFSVKLSQNGQEIIFDDLPKHRTKNWTLDTSESASDGAHDGDKITPLNIRINMAVEADWGISARKEGDPNQTLARIRQEPRFQYVVKADDLDYMDLLREDSYLNGGKDPKAEDKSSRGSELFSDRVRIGNHAQARLRDVKRIAYEGQLVFQGLNASLFPGMGLKLEGNTTYPVFGVIKSVKYEVNAQTTTIELGTPDTAQIYDAPSIQATEYKADQSASKSGGGGGSNGYGETPYTGGGGSNYSAPSRKTTEQYYDDQYGDNKGNSNAQPMNRPRPEKLFHEQERGPVDKRASVGTIRNAAQADQADQRRVENQRRKEAERSERGKHKSILTGDEMDKADQERVANNGKLSSQAQSVINRQNRNRSQVPMEEDIGDEDFDDGFN